LVFDSTLRALSIKSGKRYGLMTTTQPRPKQISHDQSTLLRWTLQLTIVHPGGHRLVDLTLPRVPRQGDDQLSWAQLASPFFFPDRLDGGQTVHD
jgi:hypothetical protein